MTARVRARRLLLTGSAAAVLGLLAPSAPVQAADAAYPLEDTYAELDAAFAAARHAAADGLVLEQTLEVQISDAGGKVQPAQVAQTAARLSGIIGGRTAASAQASQVRAGAGLLGGGEVYTETSVAKVDMRNAIAWAAIGPGLSVWQGAGRGALVPVSLMVRSPKQFELQRRALALLHRSHARWAQVRTPGVSWSEVIEGILPRSTSDWLSGDIVGGPTDDVTTARTARAGGGFSYTFHLPPGDASLLSLTLDVTVDVDADGRVVDVVQTFSGDIAMSLTVDYRYRPVTLSWPDASTYVSAARLRKAMAALATEDAAARLVRRQVKRATALQLDAEQAFLAARYDKRDHHLGPRVRVRQEELGFRVVVANRFRAHPAVWHVALRPDGSFASSRG